MEQYHSMYTSKYHMRGNKLPQNGGNYEYYESYPADRFL